MSPPPATNPKAVVIVGLGYVGLTTAVGLAKLGHRVRGVDIDAERVAKLRAGQVPIYEPGLQAALTEVGSSIAFTTDIADALSHHPDIVMLAVQTPAKDGEPSDTSFLESAARDAGRQLKQPATIVVRSTAPVGTTARVRDIVSAELGQPVRAVANPEFLAEGKALESFLQPDRIVIGVDDASSADLMRSLYEPLDAPVLVTDSRPRRSRSTSRTPSSRRRSRSSMRWRT
jgi:UDPglucose 6-dehydrogenase